MGYNSGHPAGGCRPRGSALCCHHPSWKGRNDDGCARNAGSNVPQITYDLSTQVPPNELPGLRSQILLFLKRYAPGPKPIRVQLCVCLAILAIQMKEWTDVLASVVQSLSDSPESHACILDFLRVLPEEVTEGRKITLSVCGAHSHKPSAFSLRNRHRRSTSARVQV